MNASDFKSNQEIIIHSLSSRLLGDQLVFKPELYRNSEEPADLVWISGRTAFLFYATEGGGDFLKKSRHNFSQLQRWIRRWISGYKMANGGNEFHYCDFEYIIGVSIVGGLDARSNIDTDQVSYALSKGRKNLKLCVNFSSNVFFNLMETAFGVIDILEFIEFLGDYAQDCEDDVAIDWINARIRNIREKVSLEISENLNNRKSVSYASLERALGVTVALRSKSGKSNFPIFNDLCLEDAIWISEAELQGSKLLYNGEKLGPTRLIFQRKFSGAKISLVIVSRLKDFLPDCFGNLGDGIHMMTSLDLGINFPTRIIALKGEISSREVPQRLGRLIAKFDEELR